MLNINKKKILEKIKILQEVGLYILALSFFVSTAGFNIGLGIIAIGTIVKLFIAPKDINLGNKNILYWFLFSYIVLAIWSLFSVGGIDSFIYHLNRQSRFIVILLIGEAIRDKRVFFRFLVFLGISISLSSFNGIFEHLKYPSKRIDSFLKLTHYGPALMEMLILFFAMIITKTYSYRYRIILFSSFYLLGITNILYMKTRAVWVGLFLGQLAIMFFNKKKRYFILSIVIILIIAFIGKETYLRRAESIGNIKTDTSNTTRMKLWKAGIYTFENNIIFGAGSNNDNSTPFFKQYIIKKSFKIFHFNGDPHNMYISFLAEYGLGGLLYMILIFYIIPKEFFRYYKARKRFDLDGIFYGVIGMTIGFYIVGIFWNIWYRDYHPSLGFFIGLGIFNFLYSNNERTENEKKIS
ncbi:O-antigen ligase family protein [Haliovirga abyssi]|uniref:Ligase n=1 Tax=Haliovirga abyssi TaxID=2996794 RepID=A0AAU9DBP5_9FUSO|nr:O-antigen ligase family protein [Haliovirga abyssi]BDU49682.1 ligase [Haliovirga abyssi]